MDEKEFLIQAEDLIYKEIAKNANLMLGKNKTAALSTGLFLKLPIEIELKKVDYPLERVYKTLESFMSHFSAYVKMGENTKVHMVFMYNDAKKLHSLLTNIEKYRGVFLTFVYMHEVQHILRKHTTSTYDNMMQRIASNIQNPHEAINIAEDYAINYSIKDLIKLSELNSYWHEIEQCVMYKTEYHSKKMSDIEILKNMVANAKEPQVDDKGNGYKVVSMDGKDSLQPTAGKAEGEGGDGSGDKTSTATDDADIAISDLSNSLQDIITTATKGTAAGELMEELFSAIKVETGWFKKIKASFKRQVYYKTHDFYTSWSNMNNVFRRIYKSPKKFFMDTKIEIILSVDHSGSMSTEDLQKLLYLIESESTKISAITVLIHDTRIVKSFEISDDFDISTSPMFKEALAVRYVSGGTSHDCVFRHIEDMKLKEPDKVIYMSFSDNYSDIEQTVGNYPIMRKLTKYWICAGANNPVKVAGINILMV